MGGQPGGVSGMSVWGSSPSIDEQSGLVYIATGNLYSVPQSVSDCVSAARSNATAAALCVPEDFHYNSILALYLSNGSIAWAHRFGEYDVYTLTCGGSGVPQSPGCSYAGPDADFGQASMLIRDVTITVDVSDSDSVPRTTDLVVTRQKSGFVWALDAAQNGKLVWDAFICPGGVLG